MLRAQRAAKSDVRVLRKQLQRSEKPAWVRWSFYLPRAPSALGRRKRHQRWKSVVELGDERRVHVQRNLCGRAQRTRRSLSGGGEAGGEHARCLDDCLTARKCPQGDAGMDHAIWRHKIEHCQRASGAIRTARVCYLVEVR